MTGRASLIGYLSNCGVFLDANGDGVAGSDEVAATTDSFGGYSFETATLDSGVAKVVVSTDATTYPDCVDTFTVKAPGMLKLETPASSTDSVAATALTTLAAALVRGVDGAASAAKTSGQANLWIARAFGLDDSTSFSLDTTDYLALAASDTSGDATEVFVAASTSANVIATLTALLTPACGGAAAAERFVVDAIGRRVIAARTSSSRRRLAATSAMDLESSSVVSAIANDSVTTAVAAGTIAYAEDVNPNAISAVASASSSAASHLRTAAANATSDPLAFVKTAAAVSAVIQSPEMRTAIQAASVEGVAGLESTVSASSSTLLADMGDAEKLSAAVTEAETSVVLEIPKSPPPPSPSPPPSPPAPPPFAAQPLPSATPSENTQVIEGDSGSQGTSMAESGAARLGGPGRLVATLAALAAFAV